MEDKAPPLSATDVLEKAKGMKDTKSRLEFLETEIVKLSSAELYTPSYAKYVDAGQTLAAISLHHQLTHGGCIGVLKMGLELSKKNDLENLKKFRNLMQGYVGLYDALPIPTLSSLDEKNMPNTPAGKQLMNLRTKLMSDSSATAPTKKRIAAHIVTAESSKKTGSDAMRAGFAKGVAEAGALPAFSFGSGSSGPAAAGFDSFGSAAAAAAGFGWRLVGAAAAGVGTSSASTPDDTGGMDLGNPLVPRDDVAAVKEEKK